MGIDQRLGVTVKAFENTTYSRWQKEEGIPIRPDFAIEDIRDVQLAPWPRLGANAAFVNLYAMMEGAKGLIVAEIPTGRATEEQRPFMSKPSW